VAGKNAFGFKVCDDFASEFFDTFIVGIEYDFRVLGGFVWGTDSGESFISPACAFL
jgi:hypothetical protein